MGELQTEPFQFTFNGFLKVAFQGSRITSDAGLILVRELDERLGLAGIIAAHLRDSRHGLNTQFRLPDLLRQSVYSRLAGYEDLNDAQRLSTDPTFRLIGSPTRWDRSAALTSTLHWFETELLARDDNLVGLMAVNRDLIGQAETFDRADRTVLDMDTSESPVHGQQEGSAYNGHFASVCYHPLFLFTDHGDCVAAKLRPGNVSSADGEAIEAVSGYLWTTHLHDNGGRRDDHLVPFAGTIDWDAAITETQKIGYEDVLMLEVADAGDPVEVLQRSATARDRLEQIFVTL